MTNERPWQPDRQSGGDYGAEPTTPWTAPNAPYQPSQPPQARYPQSTQPAPRDAWGTGASRSPQDYQASGPQVGDQRAGWGGALTNAGYDDPYFDAPTLRTPAVPTVPNAQDMPALRRRGAQTATITERTSGGNTPRPGGGAGRRRPKARRAILLLVIVAVLAACIIPSTVFAVNGYSLYQQDKQLASSGESHLRQGIVLLREVAGGQITPQLTAQAKQQFSLAHDNFVQLNGNLAQTPGIVNALPTYSNEVQSARKLAPIAIEGAQMGVLGGDALNILITRLSNPFAANSSGLTAADLTIISADIAQMKTLFASVSAQINALQPGDLQLDPRLGPMLAQFKASLPALQQGLTDAQTMVALAPALLGVGQPANYLVEMLDSTELRPGGGFIGNYGTLTLSAGRLADLHITDVDLLDRPFEFAGGFIPFPRQYQWFPLVSNWSLRDSNLDADFPTTARYGEQNYHLEGGTTAVQGVIAITPYMIQKALAITGPIYVPEFGETITASNLIDRIHFHQLGLGHGSSYIPDPSSLTSQRKKFTAYLFKHFLARVKVIANAKRSEFVHLLVSSLQTKDVQVYFNASGAEAVLARYHAASTIDAPPTGDSLLVVDANIIANKANDFIHYTMQDNVTLDAQGNATHHATLTYRWPVSAESSANNYGSTTYYKDYVRVYAPPQATLQAQNGWEAQGASTAFGRKAFAGILRLDYGATASITLTWTTPHAVVKSGATWQYQLLFQKQAGNTWNATTQITLPSCASNVGQITKLKSGANHTYSAQGYLYTDTTYALSYTC
ncbi:MAG: DUF4012 domain-containing protein [Ktedonobacterales bacterium]